MRILLVGIGHSLRGDDSAGLEAVRAWQRDHFNAAVHADVQVELIESPGIELADLLSSSDAVLLVDAVCSGAVAGTLHRLSGGDIAGLENSSGSAHGWGIPEALRFAKALGAGKVPQDMRVLGIEASMMEIGASLSAPVRGAMPGAAAAINAEIRTLLGK